MFLVGHFSVASSWSQLLLSGYFSWILQFLFSSAWLVFL